LITSTIVIFAILGVIVAFVGSKYLLADSKSYIRADIPHISAVHGDFLQYLESISSNEVLLRFVDGSKLRTVGQLPTNSLLDVYLNFKTHLIS